MRGTLALVSLGFVSALSIQAADRGTPEQAKTMLAKAAAHYQSVGRKQALEDFNHKKPPFGDRDLYVACITPGGMISANGGFPQFVGVSADAWKDADGKPLGRAILSLKASKREGSIDYSWVNPVTHKMEPKIGFVQKLSEDVCVVGAYKP